MDVNRFSSSSFTWKGIRYGLFAFELDDDNNKIDLGCDMHCAYDWRPHQTGQIWMTNVDFYAISSRLRDKCNATGWTAQLRSCIQSVDYCCTKSLTNLSVATQSEDEDFKICPIDLIRPKPSDSFETVMRRWRVMVNMDERNETKHSSELQQLATEK